MNTLPETGYLRISQIVGNPKAKPPIHGIIPISRAAFWNGVKTGRYPKPIKLSPRVTVWSVESIRAFIEKNNANGGTHE